MGVVDPSTESGLSGGPTSPTFREAGGKNSTAVQPVQIFMTRIQDIEYMYS